MAKTMANMIVSAKGYADMENSAFVSDAEWTEWINRGIEVVWDKMVMARGAEYYSKTSNVALVSGTEDYDLQSDFQYLLSQYIIDSGQEFYCSKFEWADEPQLRKLTANNTNIQYHLMGSTSSTAALDAQVKFLPVPTAAATWEYRYIPKPPALTALDSWDAIHGYEEYAELSAALKAKIKEESDQTGVMQLLGMVDKRILSMRSHRDGARPPRIKDTRQDWGRTNRTDWFR